MQLHNLIWTPIDAKRLALEMGGQPITWDAFLQEMLQANAIDGIGLGQIKNYKHREDCRGSSGAAARFVNGQDTDKVTIDKDVLQFA